MTTWLLALVGAWTVLSMVIGLGLARAISSGDRIASQVLAESAAPPMPTPAAASASAA